uniref:Secreted protein n=1 Tax=Oncorhynchus tshawytscha TaxID=74940 RepID=A0AAZ3RYV8_ONCTS
MVLLLCSMVVILKLEMVEDVFVQGAAVPVHPCVLCEESTGLPCIQYESHYLANGRYRNKNNRSEPMELAQISFI